MSYCMKDFLGQDRYNTLAVIVQGDRRNLLSGICLRSFQRKGTTLDKLLLTSSLKLPPLHFLLQIHLMQYEKPLVLHM